MPLAEKIIYLHFFIGACDWYVAELDDDTWESFGYTDLGEAQNAEWWVLRAAGAGGGGGGTGLRRGARPAVDPTAFREAGGSPLERHRLGYA